MSAPYDCNERDPGEFCQHHDPKVLAQEVATLTAQLAQARQEVKELRQGVETDKQDLRARLAGAEQRAAAATTLERDEAEAWWIVRGEQIEDQAMRAVAAERDRARAACPDDLRANGWSVAVHNDYRFAGVPHTFWLFTNGNRCVKGEGLTDADALGEIRSVLAKEKP